MCLVEKREGEKMRGIPTRYIIGLEGDERDSKTN
jgi:hypothetical protein